MSKLHEKKTYTKPLTQYLSELLFLIFLKLEQLDGYLCDELLQQLSQYNLWGPYSWIIGLKKAILLDYI